MGGTPDCGAGRGRVFEGQWGAERRGRDGRWDGVWRLLKRGTYPCTVWGADPRTSLPWLPSREPRPGPDCAVTEACAAAQGDGFSGAHSPWAQLGQGQASRGNFFTKRGHAEHLPPMGADAEAGAKRRPSARGAGSRACVPAPQTPNVVPARPSPGPTRGTRSSRRARGSGRGRAGVFHSQARPSGF